MANSQTLLINIRYKFRQRLLHHLLSQGGTRVHLARLLVSVLASKPTQTCAICRVLKKQLNQYKDKLQAIYTSQREKIYISETKIQELTTNQDSL